MRVFEYHFNPPSKKKLSAGKEDVVFDSFCFEAKNVYEKRMGSLYLTGFLKNVLPQNINFLEALADRIKDKYYQNISLNPERSLREALKIANEHLEKIAKKGDVSWLGNLSFAALSFKNFELNFSKVGDFKILLLRKGQLIDIDQRLRFDEIEPYPLKIFGNIVSGKLAENDALLVLNEEVYQTFLKENLLDEISKRPLSDFTKILDAKKEALTKTSGICLLILLIKEAKEKEREVIVKQQPLKLSLPKEVFTPILKLFKKLKKIRLPKLSFPKLRFQLPKIGKQIILTLLLLFVLTSGLYLFQKNQNKKIKSYQAQLDQMQVSLDYLTSRTITPATKNDLNILYKELWEEVTALPLKLPKTINNQVSELRANVLKNLYTLNNIEEIKEPELIFETKTTDQPNKLIRLKDNFYLFSLHTKNILKFNLKENKTETISLDKDVDALTFSENTIFLFSEPNQITMQEDTQTKETTNLQLPAEGFSLKDLTYYKSNLYLINSNTILKYAPTSEKSWQTYKSWLTTEKETTDNFKSMAIDSAIWILTEENIIKKYYTGKLEKTITLDIFPEIKNISKIFTSIDLPYLYLLEPSEKRLIVLDKDGLLIKQYLSQTFNNLLDFSISSDGNAAYLLNDAKIYKIDLTR